MPRDERGAKPMTAQELLKQLNLTTIPGEWYDRVRGWLDWYGGKADFHSYRVYNGERFQSRERASLSMAKKVCEDKADLLLNEKVTITVEGGEMQAFVDDVLHANNFWVRGNQMVEIASATGTGAFTEFLQADGAIGMDYIPAQCIFPLSWENRRIVECAFASARTEMGKAQTYVNVHRRENGLYVVENYLFDDKGTPLPLPEGVEARWETGCDVPMFQIYTPNIVNNLPVGGQSAINFPMGVSVFAGAIDVLKGIDLIYDSYNNEFQLGKKRIFVDGSVLKIDKGTGADKPIFDTNDTVFYSFPMGDTTGDSSPQKIVESNMTLRAEQHEQGLQSQLSLLSEKCGFGKGYYRLDAEGSVQTATAVVSQNSQLFRKIKKDEIILYDVLTNMVRAILFLGGHPVDVDISIGFDDSIIEDTEAIARRALLEFGAGIIDEVEYIQRVYGHTEEAAQELVNTMRKRKPVEELYDPSEGGVSHVDT